MLYFFLGAMFGIVIGAVTVALSMDRVIGKKSGLWLSGSEPTKEFVCSECKGLVQTACYTFRCYYRYCPNCGAKMDGGEANA